jgi:hypothetical protein
MLFKGHVNSGSLQFAFAPAARSIRSNYRALELRPHRFCSLALASFLAALFAHSPLGATEGPGATTLQTTSTAAQLMGVRFSSDSNHSRVLLDLSGNVQYKVGRLTNPERLYFDLQQTEISPRFAHRRIALGDAIVGQIRIGATQGPVTRVVLDLRSAAGYRISELSDPARMLVELNQPSSPTGPSSSTDGQTYAPSSSAENSPGASANPLSTPPGGASDFQESPSHPDQELAPQAYGSGEKTGLEYAGTASPRNSLLLGLDFGSLYNDNVLGNNLQKVGDAEFLIGPSISLRREGNRFSLAFTYQPHFLIYRNESGLNTLNQALGFDTSYRATYRLSFRARVSANYTNGIFQAGQDESGLGPGSLSGINETLYTPTLRQFSLNSRVDGAYMLGPHDTVSLYAGQSLLNFEQQVPNAGELGNTQETDAGLLYQHQMSPHTTFGINYNFQDIFYSPDSRTLVNSVFLSYSQRLSPSVSFSVFGGPQYSTLNGFASFSLGPLLLQVPASSADWNWALGGTLTKRLERTVFQVSAAHQVTNGGGFIGAVVSTSAGLSARRRLVGHWDSTWYGSYANNTYLASGGPPSAYQSVTAGFGLERPLSNKLSMRMGYDFLRQRATGQSSTFANIDSDLFSVRFYYRFREIPLNQ